MRTGVMLRPRACLLLLAGGLLPLGLWHGLAPDACHTCASVDSSPSAQATHRTRSHNVGVCTTYGAHHADEAAAAIPSEQAPMQGKVTVVTLSSGLDPQVRAAVRLNRELYCAAHNYTYCEYSALLDPSRTPSWNKVLALLLALQSSQLVYVLDADALIRNYTISLEATFHNWSTTPDGTSHDVLFASDYDQQPADVPTTWNSSLNGGGVLVRSSARSLAFFTAVFNDFPWDMHVETRWWEQAAILSFRARHPAAFLAHARIVPNAAFNQHFAWYERGDFISHYAGRPSRTKWREIQDTFHTDCGDAALVAGGCPPVSARPGPASSHAVACEAHSALSALRFWHLLVWLPSTLCQHVLGVSKRCFWGVHLSESCVTALGAHDAQLPGAAHTPQHLRMCLTTRTGLVSRGMEA